MVLEAQGIALFPAWRAVRLRRAIAGVRARRLDLGPVCRRLALAIEGKTFCRSRRSGVLTAGSTLPSYERDWREIATQAAAAGWINRRRQLTGRRRAAFVGKPKPLASASVGTMARGLVASAADFKSRSEAARARETRAMGSTEPMRWLWRWPAAASAEDRRRGGLLFDQFNIGESGRRALRRLQRQPLGVGSGCKCGKRRGLGSFQSRLREEVLLKNN